MIDFLRKFFQLEDNPAARIRAFEKERASLPADIRDSFVIKPQCDMVPKGFGSFGYDVNNPIPVCLQKGQIDYLARLRCACDRPFFFHRIGLFDNELDQLVDGYELICQAHVHHIFLYMDMYYAGVSTKVPEGLSLGSPRGMGLPFTVTGFPDNLPQAIKQARSGR